MFWSTINLVKNNHIKARIFFVFLENSLNQTGNDIIPNFDVWEKIEKAAFK